jgi:hypothetical protein
MRTPEEIRDEIEAERSELTGAVDDLRSAVGKATNVTAKVKAKLPLIAAVGGIGATLRILARRSRAR